MSNVKSMDFLAIVQTILKKNPGGLPAKELVEKLIEKTKLSRSTVYVHLDHCFCNREIFRQKGRYWLADPRLSTYRKPAWERDMVRHSRSAIKGLSDYSTKELLEMIDSDEFARRFPDFAEHVMTGYRKLHTLFETYRQLPSYVKVSHIGQGSESKETTKEQEKLFRGIFNEVKNEKDLIIRKVEAGHYLAGKCRVCW